MYEARFQAKYGRSADELGDEVRRARERVRAQIGRVRAAIREGGDVKLAMQTLRCLRLGYAELRQLRCIRLARHTSNDGSCGQQSLTTAARRSISG